MKEKIKKMKVKMNVWAPAVILFLPRLLQIVEGVAHSEKFIFLDIDSKPSTCTWFVCCNDTLCPTIQNICCKQPEDQVSNHNNESIWKYCSLRIRLSIKIVKVFESIFCKQLGDQIEFVMGQRLYWNREKKVTESFLRCCKYSPRALGPLKSATWMKEP